MKKLLFIGLAAGFASAAFGQNLVVDGNFAASTGASDAAPPGWTLTPGASGEDCFSEPTGGPNTGDGYFAFGNVASTVDVISQSIATVVGQHYTFSAALKGGGTPEDINVYWNTNTFGGVGNQFSGQNFGTDGTWSTMSWNVVATATSTTIAFGGYNGPAFSDLSDVSLVAHGTPEPASMAVLGLGALALIRRRRSSK